MKKRFSDQQLFFVRNHIPIRYVIESLLNIQAETVQGIFRFRCPLCAGSHTGIKLEKNLARCFDCRENFNTIDICMKVRYPDFVDSVEYLLNHKNSSSVNQQPGVAPSQLKSPVVARKECKAPVGIKEILDQLITKNKQVDQIYEKRKPVKQAVPSINDITELERILHALSQVILRLKTIHYSQE
jgi:hypothetical protein